MSEIDLQADIASDPRITAFVSPEYAVQLSDYLTKLGQPQQVMAGQLKDAVAYCKQHVAPMLLLVDISQEKHPLVALEDLIQAAGPACRVIVLGQQNDVNLYRSLLGEGVVDYLLLPVAFDQLAQVLQRAQADQPAHMQAMGRTIAITGASGGCGTSTLTAALGQTLASSGYAPSALVDFDRRGGDLSLLLGSGPVDGLRAALQSGYEDPRLLLRTLSRINERTYLLAQQPDIEPEALFEDQALQLGGALCRLFGLSIWDLPAQRDSACMEVLRHAEVRVVLTDLTVQDARKVLRLLREIGDERNGQQLLLIANACRQGTSSAVPRAQFEEFVGHAIDLQLPWAGTALSSSLLKGPLSLDAAPAFREATAALADTLMGRQPVLAANRGMGVVGKLREIFSRTNSHARKAA